MSTDNPLPSHKLIEVRVTSIREAANATKLYQLEPLSGGTLPPAEAGAHIGIHLPNDVIRQYSLVHPSPNPSSYTVGVKRDPNSSGGSQYMHEQLREGVELKIEAPRNNFPLEEKAKQSVLFAGGIGITPIFSMIQRLEEVHGDWQLYYACQTRGDAVFLQELESHNTGGQQRVHLHFDDEHGGQVLNLADIIKPLPQDTHIYCCGPAPMLEAFESVAAGRPTDNIHVEYFSAKEETATEGGFIVELARSKAEVFVPQGKSILYALLDAGYDMPFSCEEGVCGSCEMRVLSGIPDHRDVILSDKERAANDTMMICCSGCKSDRLVLDY